MFLGKKKNYSLKKKFFWNFMKWGLKGGISIDADSDRYVLWCCGSICPQPDTFFKIGSGHTVRCRPAFDLMVVTLIVEAVKATITRKTLMLAIMYFSIKLYRFQLNCFRYFPSFYSKFNVVSDKKKSSRGALRIILCARIT